MASLSNPKTSLNSVHSPFGWKFADDWLGSVDETPTETLGNNRKWAEEIN